MRIARNLLDQIVEHARREAPNECCGFVASRDDVVTAVRPMENAAASPLRFQMDNQELYRAVTTIEDSGQDLAAVYHSHTRTEPYPSQTDINYSEKWPGLEWLIVGLSGDDVTV